MLCLLDAGADNEKATSTGLSPLHLVALSGHEAVAQSLLDASAEAENAADGGFTPLHLAADPAANVLPVSKRPRPGECASFLRK